MVARLGNGRFGSDRSLRSLATVTATVVVIATGPCSGSERFDIRMKPYTETKSVSVKVSLRNAEGAVCNKLPFLAKDGEKLTVVLCLWKRDRVDPHTIGKRLTLGLSWLGLPPFGQRRAAECTT